MYYLPYGHHLYKEEVMKMGLYNQSNRNHAIRFYTYHAIAAKVAKIDFFFKECRDRLTFIRCIYITLRPVDPAYGHIIHVKYHDMHGVVDFLVLREHYEQSIAKEYHIGQHFKSIVDDHYWFGTIIGYNEANYCQRSQFKKYHIRWHSNNAVDLLSPWDIEEVVETDSVFDETDSVPISDRDRRNFFHKRAEEWPGFNETKELNRLSKGYHYYYTVVRRLSWPVSLSEFFWPA